MKRYLLLFIMTLTATLLITINVIFFLKEKTCTYKIEEEFYEEEVTIKIKRFNDTKITKEYTFTDEEIKKLEEEDLKSDGYEVTSKDLKLTATKKEKLKDYFKEIEKYESQGFVCKQEDYMAIIYGSDETFKDSIKEDVVLVDFYADWCGPCKMLSPIIDEVAKETSAKIVKINVDKCPITAKEYGVMSIPTLIVFKDGKEINKQIGLCSKQALMTMLKIEEDL